MLQRLWKLLHPTVPTSFDEVITILLNNRHIHDKEALFNPSPSHINFELPQINKVAERIHKAIKTGEKMVVFGDYDVDGLCATTIMWETLHSLGADAKPYIPHRELEGYGLSQRALENVIEKYNPQLIITVDCGISSASQIAYAKSKGIEVIVTDHHTAPPQLPECLIIHDHHVCGAAVAYKTSQSLIKDETLSHSTLSDHLGLAALGTICDILPLSIENRAIVTHGLQQLQHTSRPGIKAICKNAGIDQYKLETYHLGYTIGPRLNAQGRLDHAMEALRLLCTRDPARAELLASQVQSINSDRQELTKELSDAATMLAQNTANDHILIIGDPSWNPGIIGLIASHLVKEFYKPAIVWGSSSEHPDLIKASARSINGVNITEHIRLFKDHLLSHGGHPMAAGLSLHKQNLELFKNGLIDYANNHISAELLQPQLTIDMPLDSTMISLDLHSKIQKLSPFGAEYPEPVFQFENIKVLNAKAIGKSANHLKLTIQDTEQNMYDGLFWNKGYLANTLGGEINIAARLETNTFNGTTKPQLNIVDMREK